jgi:hypothetical protein
MCHDTASVTGSPQRGVSSDGLKTPVPLAPLSATLARKAASSAARPGGPGRPSIGDGWGLSGGANPAGHAVEHPLDEAGESTTTRSQRVPKARKRHAPE